MIDIDANEYPNYPAWKNIEPPYYWIKHNLTVVGDRFTQDGTREHLVIEQVPEGCILSNANIYSLKD